MAEVLSKKAADERFEEATNNDEIVGMVHTEGPDGDRETLGSLRHIEIFSVLVSLPAKQKATFKLNYMHRLVRHHGFYTHRISLRPGQLVENFNVTIQAYEPEGFQFLNVTSDRGTILHGLHQTPFEGNIFKEFSMSLSSQQQLQNYGEQGKNNC